MNIYLALFDTTPDVAGGIRRGRLFSINLPNKKGLFVVINCGKFFFLISINSKQEVKHKINFSKILRIINYLTFCNSDVLNI